MVTRVESGLRDHRLDSRYLLAWQKLSAFLAACQPTAISTSVGELNGK